MGKIPDELREIIAWNIRLCRMKKFPGRGGGKKCAEAFGVSPQQWSPWECGKRTPDEVRLTEIAEFFGVTVAWMRQDQRQPPVRPPVEPSLETPHGSGQDSFNMGSTGSMPPPFGGIAGMNIPPPLWESAPPGSAASFFWLAQRFIIALETQGLHVQIDKQSLEYLAHCLKSS